VERFDFHARFLVEVSKRTDAATFNLGLPGQYSETTVDGKPSVGFEIGVLWFGCKLDLGYLNKGFYMTVGWQLPVDLF
jgi:hypothetical protein